MKRIKTYNPIAGLVVLLASTPLLVTELSMLAQGAFDFNNHGLSGSPFAPVYGPEQESPYVQKWGNAADANPPGTQVYSGAPLDASYSVEAWYSLTPVSDVFALNLNAASAPGSLTGVLGAGVFSIGFVPILEGNSQVYVQVRAWDNADGQVISWEEAWVAAQAGSGRAVGWSKVFLQPLDWPPGYPPGMENFESFNVFIVPEPSTFALFGLGGLALLLVGRRNSVGS